MGKITSFRESGRRYTAFRVIGFLFTLIGVILLVIGGGLLGYGVYVVATGGASAAAPPPNPEALFPGPQVINGPFPVPIPTWLWFLWSFAILFGGLQWIALGAFFRLMIDMEENTRASAQMLDKLQSRLEASPGRGEAMFQP
jgi:hypothetical protein